MSPGMRAHLEYRLSLGLRGPYGTEDIFIDALQKIAEAGKKNGLPVGAWVPNSEAVTKYSELGFSWFAVGGDAFCLVQGGMKLLKDARDAKSSKI